MASTKHTQMKNALIRFLQYTVSNKTIFLKVKDIFFCNPSEHLFRITNYANSNYKDKLDLPILDIGAADGGTAAYFCKKFNKAKIIAFEPIEKMFKIAANTNIKNTNVEVRNIALSNAKGETEINITANYLSSSLNDLNVKEFELKPNSQKEKFLIIEKQKVITSTLDDETKNIKELLMIKIDTQGSELSILKSGIETLRKTNLILIEMNNHGLYNNGCQYYEVDEFLRNNNFKLIDMIVTYRPNGLVEEYDAIYEKIN